MHHITYNVRITLHPLELFSGTVPESICSKETIVLIENNCSYTNFSLHGTILIMTLGRNMGVIVFDWVARRKVLQVSLYTKQCRMPRC